MIKKISVAKLISARHVQRGRISDRGRPSGPEAGGHRPWLKCKTCGGSVKTCPGHFGYLELVRPVIHPEFAKSVYMLLQSTCYQCHKALLTTEQMTRSSR